jgi:hypothetical protein
MNREENSCSAEKEIFSLAGFYSSFSKLALGQPRIKHVFWVTLKLGLVGQRPLDHLRFSDL